MNFRSKLFLFLLGGNSSSSENYTSHADPYPYRLSLRNSNRELHGSKIITSLLSPTLQATVIDSHGVCMEFHFRVTGAQTELNVIIERKGMAAETLWKVCGSNRSSTWKEGRVWLGIVSQFRVGFFFVSCFNYKPVDSLFALFIFIYV